jgi:hypothetical protein
MKKVLLFICGILFLSPVMSDDVGVSAGGTGQGSWVVIGDDIYFCLWLPNDRNATCYRAKKVESR